MTQRVPRTIEKPTGRGEVYRNEQWLADVQYNLQVRQEYLITITLGRGRSEVPGAKDVTGQIQVLNGDRDLISEHGILTLHLADGRKWLFFASQGNVLTGTYTVQNSSGEGITT